MAPPKKGNFNNKKSSNGALGKKSLSKEKTIDELYGKSEIDAFTDKKNKVDLSLFQKKNNNNKKTNKKEEITLDYSDEEVEDFDEDSFDDDDDFVDDGDDDEILEKKTKKKDLDLENKFSWGGEKKSYYTKQIDDQNAIPSDEEEEEEAEAKELQKQREKSIKDEDLDDEQSFKKLVKKNDKSSSTSKSEDKMLNSMNKDLDSINFGSKGVEIEKLEKNISNFTKQEKLKYLISESPLLLELLEEFKVKIAEIKTTILPILEKVKNNEIPTSKGISFLETKYHLLLSYCLNITYFLMLKSSGVSIKDHPVVDQLVKIRVMIEKMKPLDKKLKYQVEKLLKNASTGTIGVSEDDPLRFKPNLSSMKKKSSRQQQQDSDDEDEDDQEQSQMLSNAGIYQAPKYGSRGGLIDEEDKATRQQDKKKRDQLKAANSKMAKFIQETYGDQPEEETDLIEQNIPIDEEVDRKRYEEENFTRITLSKKERKLEAQKKKKLSDGLDDIGDFNDLSGLADEEDKEERENKKYLANKRMAMMMNNLSQMGKNKRPRGAEDELLTDSNNNRRQQQQMDYDDDIPSGGDDDGEEEFQYDGIPRGDGDYENEYTQDSKVGEKRKISKKIDDNRGLTRIRNPEYKTPHLRNRSKYEKAIKKRNNQIQKGDRKDTSYKGVKNVNTRTIKAQTYVSS